MCYQETEMDLPIEEEIKRVIQVILNEGNVILSKHARQRMSERGYSFSDIKHILKTGIVTETGSHKDRHTLCGEDLDGHPGEVVVELRISSKKMIIITAKGGVK